MDILVATSPLVKGQTVQEAQDAGLIGTQQLPRKAVPAGALEVLAPTDAELVFASDVTIGEVLMRPRLTAALAPSGELVIPDGKLAVTVQLEDPARVGDFVRVGSQIAIFDSYNVFEGNEGDTWTPSGDHLADEFPKNKATQVLLPRVEVLAIGQETVPADRQADAPEAGGDASDAPADPGAAALVKTLVTVAVDPAQAVKLVHGTQTGTLYLGLLGTTDIEPGQRVDNRTLFDQ